MPFSAVKITKKDYIPVLYKCVQYLKILIMHMFATAQTVHLSTN